MSLYSALTTSVAGMSAQSSAMQNISGNIANVSTTGYKRVDTAFVDLVSNYTSNKSAQTSGSVLTNSRQTNTVAGSVDASDTTTHMSISGDGYFVVYEKISEIDGMPIFEGTPLYTRRGDFTLDEDGYFVNEAGYYLAVIELDNATGNPVSSVPTPATFEEDFMAAEATTTITYTGNLPAVPSTTDTSGSMITPLTGYTVDPRSTGAGVIQAQDETQFLSQSISGGAITAYVANGENVSVQLRWGKISDSPDTWNLFYQSDSTATGGATKWTNVGTDYVFNSSGGMTAPVASVTVAGMTIDGTSLGNIILDHGGDGITAYSTQTGVANMNLSQDGAAAGELSSISIDNSGYVVANYSNGKSSNMAEVILASFDGDNYLARESGGAFRATEDSGEAILGATGSIRGSSLESSNVDIADEFSKMIVSQQAYTANTRVLSTARDMLSEVMQVIR
ncbi:flagellar hook-basal body complex protein [uncultured Cohaesibacter sp.]|uniref:flagellar hook protein FlgE n=1 Tax=uncultured Cohaesibacter sp. TaxID=1002546 RepID=UPI00292F538D|nr:flagellar hook-basal body complex protein [uncultured Cohaesibacter sp.]